MMNNKSQEQSATLILGVLAVFLCTQATFALNPALAQLAAKYTDLPYTVLTYLSTIPNLIGIPMGIIGGALIKKGMKYKTLILAAILCMVVGGAAPYVIRNFAGWLAARCLFGLGFGVVVPMSGTMVLRTFTGNQAAKVQGWGAIVQNVSGIALQMLSGIIAMANVDYVWLLHLIFIIPLVLFLVFAKEPEAAAEEEAANDSSKGGSLPVSVWLMSAGYGLLFMFVYPILLNMSAILANENIGDASLAGTVSSLYSVGGMVSGVVFAPVYGMLKKWFIPVFALGTAASLFLGYVAATPVLIMIAVFLVGFFAMSIWPASVIYFGKTVEPDSMAFANGIFSAAINLFCFFAARARPAAAETP